MAINAVTIQALGNESSLNSRFFGWLTKRQKHSAEITVNYAQRIIGDCTRSDVITLFKSLEKAGLGEFILGRRGGVSRFFWHVNLPDVGRAYEGLLDEIEQLDKAQEWMEGEDIDDDAESAEEDQKSGWLQHKFPLRRGVVVTINLPEDLTESDAKRMSTWLMSLASVSE